MSGQRHRLDDSIPNVSEKLKGKNWAFRKCVYFLSNHRMFAEICPKHIAKQTDTRKLTESEIEFLPNDRKVFATAKPYNEQRISIHSHSKRWENYFIIVIIITWNEQNFLLLLSSMYLSPSLFSVKMNACHHKWIERVNPYATWWRLNFK